MLPDRKIAVKALVGVSGLLASAVVMSPTGASAARSLEPAGSAIVWGVTASTCDTPVSGSESGGPFAALVRSEQGEEALGVNADGLLTQPLNSFAGIAVPAALADQKVKAVSVAGRKAAAVTADGTAHIWGDTRGYQPGTFSPQALGAKAVDVSVGKSSAVVLLDDGTVGAITGSPYARVAGLENVAELVSDGTSGFLARIAGGGLRTFKFEGPAAVETSQSLPAAVRGDDLPDPIASFAPNSIAVTESGVVHSWTGTTADNVPEFDFEGKVIDVATLTQASTSSWRAVLTDQNEIAVWGTGDETAECVAALTELPEALKGRELTALLDGATTFSVIALEDVAPKSEPTISNLEPEVGDTLTGTPAKFSGNPVVTNRWLVNGEPIEGATGTTLKLTPDLEGKSITFQSIGTRGDEAPVFSSPSGATQLVKPFVVKDSVTRVAAASRYYGAGGAATVTVGNTFGRTVAGTVTLTGAGPAQTKPLVGGKATFALPRTLSPAGYTLSAAYSGSTELKPSSSTGRYTVVRAKSGRPAYKTTKTPTSKKSGKATVSVGTGSGLAKASGKVTVTLKKGSSSKKVSGSLSGGKRTVKLPKLKKGTWKVTVSYAGDRNYVAQKSKTYTLKVRK